MLPNPHSPSPSPSPTRDQRHQRTQSSSKSPIRVGRRRQLRSPSPSQYQSRSPSRTQTLARLRTRSRARFRSSSRSRSHSRSPNGDWGHPRNGGEMATRNRHLSRGRSRSRSESRTRHRSRIRARDNVKRKFGSPASSSSSHSSDTDEARREGKKKGILKASAGFLGAIAVTTYAVHKFWPKGFLYGGKEEWEDSPIPKKIDQARETAHGEMKDTQGRIRRDGGLPQTPLPPRTIPSRERSERRVREQLPPPTEARPAQQPRARLSPPGDRDHGSGRYYYDDGRTAVYVASTPLPADRGGERVRGGASVAARDTRSMAAEAGSPPRRDGRRREQYYNRSNASDRGGSRYLGEVGVPARYSSVVPSPPSSVAATGARTDTGPAASRLVGRRTEEVEAVTRRGSREREDREHEHRYAASDIAVDTRRARERERDRYETASIDGRHPAPPQPIEYRREKCEIIRESGLPPPPLALPFRERERERDRERAAWEREREERERPVEYVYADVRLREERRPERAAEAVYR